MVFGRTAEPGRTIAADTVTDTDIERTIGNNRRDQT